MADYYKTLGVSRSATQDEIRKAYKKLARENHPDVKPGDEEAAKRFKEAAEAYDVLGDEEKRKKYDQFGEAYKYAGKGGAGPFPGGGFQGSGPIDLSDLFGGQVDLGDILGGAFGGGGPRAQARPRPMSGRDVRSNIDIPFQMAATGGSYDVSIQRDGKVERLEVKIPAGVKTGSVVRLAEEGEAGRNGGKAGDLLITVRVGPHPYFRREGNDVYFDLPVSVAEAALGARIDVPTLTEGQVTLTVPPGSSSGTKLRLRGKGIPDLKTKEPGNQYAVIKIIVPGSINDAAAEHLRQFDAAAPVSPRAGLW